MGGTRIDLSDVTALAAYSRLAQGMAKLGAIATKQLNESVTGNSLRVLKVRKSDTGFVPNWFFGSVMTPQGQVTTKSPFVVWAGVLAEDTYELAPQTQGLPELNVGLGVWRLKDALGAEELGIIEALLATLNSTDQTSGWHYKIVNRDKYGPCLLITRSITLIDVHRLANGQDWDDIAADIFNQWSKALLRALQHTTNDGKSNFEQAFYEMTQEAEPV